MNNTTHELPDGMPLLDVGPTTAKAMRDIYAHYTPAQLARFSTVVSKDRTTRVVVVPVDPTLVTGAALPVSAQKKAI